MLQQLANGVWPTMITPFTDGGKIDYDGVRQIIEWYDGRGVTGIFAVCQSSEMSYLSIEERAELAGFVARNAPPHMKVIASGHVAKDAKTQIEDAKRIIDAGITAYVFITGNLAAENEGDEVLLGNLFNIINTLCQGMDISIGGGAIDRGVITPDNFGSNASVGGAGYENNANLGSYLVSGFGLYECPWPYHRTLSPQTLKRIAESGAVSFLKDTCCDSGRLTEKLNAIKGAPLKLFNANTPTLLHSLRRGASGYSGVMANFHPELYAWICDNYDKRPEAAERAQAFAGALSVMQHQQYPVNAKYHMTLEGLKMGIGSRARDARRFRESERLEVEQFHATYNKLKEQFQI